MVERLTPKADIKIYPQELSDPKNRCYFDKGGHILRGVYRKTQIEIEMVFPGLHMRNIGQTIEMSWVTRRGMRRITQNGKR